MFTQEIGQGLPVWLPKGAILRETLVDLLRMEQRRRGYLPPPAACLLRAPAEPTHAAVAGAEV